jgi:putative glutamine amidotransferase
MNNIIIGVMARCEELDGKEYEVISRSSFKYLNGKCSYVGLISFDGKIDINVLNLCDGIILTGGNDIYSYHFEIVDYCLNRNIPILGICMGSQILGLYSFGGNDEDLVMVDGHYKTDHNIEIDKNSVLYEILGERIRVNSRHRYALPRNKVRYKVGASSSDGVIESIEYIDDNHFLLGVEWHPEDMDNMESLYNYFIKEVLVRKRSRQ